jgi:hypothetical protein
LTYEERYCRASRSTSAGSISPSSVKAETSGDLQHAVLQLDFEALFISKRQQAALHALERPIGVQPELLFGH